ncbi:hypothetical protein [Kamptonema formosum]|uniref:hypothetical protein n=1 Tax=Kamptonema formosum TaxID=331992 RepID=UPI00034AB7AD|nr:hypothetical protein [Oscillatoria sp. PCC 10802]
MSHLTIVDLSFCESAIPTNREVRGGLGVTVYSPRGAYSTSANSAHSSGYFTGYYFDRSTGSVGYVVSAGHSAGVAAAVAGAIADGSTYAGTYTGAGTF